MVLAWNDLGMHCLNPTYDQAVILPPYNTVWAQVIRKGNPPSIVTSGVTVSYSLVGNTTSSNKRSYGQFWTYCQDLFGAPLAVDTGLNLEDPLIHNGLAGNMVLKGDHFQVNGIPVVPVNDTGTWNPYQVALVTVRDSGGTLLAQTRTTVPTSDEINCAKCATCHNATSTIPQVDTGTTLYRNAAGHGGVYCAGCHSSPHAMVPSRVDSDNYQVSQYHGALGASHPINTLGSCGACHGSSRPGSASEFAEEHGGERASACAVCHTGFSDARNTSKWPHAFQWKSR